MQYVEFHARNGRAAAVLRSTRTIPTGFVPRGCALASPAVQAVVVGMTLLCGALRADVAPAPDTSFAAVVGAVQPKIVKIYGAGGVRGLEAYQSGFLISPNGHVLTVWSYVLDTDFVTVTLDDGRKFPATLVGADPRYELAVIKIDAEQLPCFSLSEAVSLEVGDRVLAFSNLFGVATGNEAASVLHGCVTATTTLAGRRGAFETPYQGPVYVLDAMTNNPGAAGGVLTDRQGQLAGLVGKELRNALSNTWLNYAVPIDELVSSVDDILAGKTLPRTFAEDKSKPVEPWTPVYLGLRLVPDVLTKTPPFVDVVRPDTPAAAAGLRRDDLILFVDQIVVTSCTDFVDRLEYIDRIDPVRLTVQRGQELVEILIEPQGGRSSD
jgi:serine protease Do